MTIISKDKNRNGEEVILYKDTTSDISPIYIIEIEGNMVFQSKNAEQADIRFYNIIMTGF